MPDSPAAQVHRLLLDRAATVSCAESLTGGALADALSSTPGASATFVGAVVSYATSVKRSLLSVPQALIDSDGVVSAACASRMATGAQTLLGSSYAVSTTGVAGPDRQEGKPVGLVYVAVAGPSTVEVRELNLDGTRTQIRTATVDAALWMLHEIVGASG